MARFLNERLNDPQASEVERLNLIATIDPTSGSWIPISKVPVDDALASTATVLLQRTSERDRRLGAALLGGYSSARSQSVLINVIDSDPDPRVKAVAIRSLARVGDRSCIEYLVRFNETYWRTHPPSELKEGASYLRGSLDAALRRLASRFSE